jgi:tricorn protease
MKKHFLLYIAFLAGITSLQAQYFISDPSISPDAKTIVFSSEGDIWSISAKGGNAFRLTGMSGNETNAVFSPDGKWIAFTSNQDGNSNVYIIPADGGQIVQLTYFDGSDVVDSWSWDSQWIFFTSGRYNMMSTYKVSVNGGTPIRLFDNYFNWPHNLIENPITKEYIFNTSWESSSAANRKHYKGDFNPDLETYNPSTKEYNKITDYRGKDMWPTIDASGNLYYVSDQGNEEYNLYKYESGKPKQLTSFNESIKKPKVSANGEKIVFEKGYQLFLYDVKNGTANAVPIIQNSGNSLVINQEFNVKGKISNFNVSPDGKKIAFVSRGMLFVSDIDGKFTKQIKTDPAERVSEVMWLKDNQTLLYNRTVNGWQNLFTTRADITTEEKQLSNEQKHNGNISINESLTKALFYSGIHELKILDLQTFKSETLVKDEFWGNGTSTVYFSPDNKYILYTAIRNFEQDIFIYDIEKKNAVNITNTGVSESDPQWSPDGKYIYFSTDRVKPSFPRGEENSDIYRIALRNYDTPFKSDHYKKLFSEIKKDSSKAATVIDFENLKDRWQAIAAQNGNQTNPYIIQKDDAVTVLYTSGHNGESGVLWQTTTKPFAQPETKIIEGAKNCQQITKVKDNYFILAGGTIFKLDLGASKLKATDIDFKFAKNLEEEFKQMFYETWANMQEYYYDEKFHGVDWAKIKTYYENFLPSIKSRANLRVLLNDMLGELNSSHLGFSSYGDEEKTYYRTTTNDTGILWDNEKPFIVKRVVKASPADRYDKNILTGDELVAVNGERIDKSKNRGIYFNSPSILDEIVITLKRDNNEFDVKIHPQQSGAMSRELYDEWIEGNENYVTKLSEGKLAYIHMRSMGNQDLRKFMTDLVSKFGDKDGLILDIRYNTGGNVHDAVLQMLSQRPYLMWKFREGKIAPQPNFAPSGKPIILMVNEQTLSDGEMTSAGFKQLGLGKIIGTETYRWIIFTSGKMLVDGSYHRMPMWGCYTLDGKDIESTGVTPDIYVKQSFKDRLDNKDPQLEKAIEEALKQIK